MRLVVDLQACETGSSKRGIGRYAMSLVTAIASELGETDELIIAIDMADTSCVQDARYRLRRRNVRAKVVAYGYPSTPQTDLSPPARRLAGQLRARFYAGLRPDVMLICSLFEMAARFTTELDWKALGRIPVAVVAYDVIPLLFPDHYLLADDFDRHLYQARLDDLLQFDLILSISAATSRDLIAHLGVAEDRIAFIGAGFDDAMVCAHDKTDGQRRLHELGIARPFVLTVGNGDWRKNCLGALQAYADLPAATRDSYDLVFTMVGDDVRRALDTDYAELRNQVHILGWLDDATLALLYRECHVFYFPSRYEGFGFPVLEAMSFGAPVLSSNAGSLPEVAHDKRILFDPDGHEENVALLARVLSDARFREEIRRGAREHALGFTWQKSARLALHALRSLAKRGTPERQAQRHADPAWPLGRDISLMASACMDAGERGERALADGLQAIARGGVRRVLVDITEIVMRDAGTGIQRVTRRFFAGLAAIAREHRDFQVEPFCWTEQGICYARGYARDKLDVPCEGSDILVQVKPSDLVFMLDSSWHSPERFDALHARVHVAGGEVVWMVYDLIPIRFPQTCDPSMPPAFRAWLTHAVRTADGLVCISETTRQDLEAFMGDVVRAGDVRPWTRGVHLGCDLDPSADSHPSDKGVGLRTSIGTRPYFTALGTLEPRKDYKTIIDAFELLWKRGVDVALFIIGKRGWHVDKLVKRIEGHPERDKRLFWTQGASDSDVRHLLEGSAALIQASISEGYGLPLIEAGSLGVPLIASDIAVFHEIAGDGAAYFRVGDAVALAEAVRSLLGSGSMRQTMTVRFQTWAQASAALVDVLGLT